MAFTKNQLRSINIRNPHEYSKGNPFIVYHPAQTGRWSQNAAWLIIWPNHIFKDVPWYDHGNLAFNIYHRSEKENMLLEAQKKLMEIFKLKELAKTPFNTWMDAEFVKIRNAEIKELIKNSK